MLTFGAEERILEFAAAAVVESVSTQLPSFRELFLTHLAQVPLAENPKLPLGCPSMETGHPYVVRNAFYLQSVTLQNHVSGRLSAIFGFAANGKDKRIRFL